MLLTLEKLFSSSQSEIPLPTEYLCPTIKIIWNGLNSENDFPIIIQNTKHIFNIDISGLLILIPLYLNRIEQIIKSPSSSGKLKSSCMTIISSLLCFPDNYVGYKIHSINKNEAPVTMKSIKEKIYMIVIILLKDCKNLTSERLKSIDEKMIRAACKAICCTIVIIYQETLTPNINKNLIYVIILL